MDTNTISLCLITKNEEEKIASCLNSSCKYVDEIIVVDTGSTDKTIEICEEYGARVIKKPWQDSFSLARNQSIEAATGDWILILDADEFLPLKTARSLQKLTRNRDVKGWIFNMVNYITLEKNRISNHPNLRMFQNDKRFCFEGRVHEQIKPSILKENSEAVIKHSGLEIIHQGYRQDLPGCQEKSRRNIKLLKLDLAENPEDSFINYNLGNSYYKINDLDHSIHHYQNALENIDHSTGFAAVLYRNYILCLIEVGEYAKALSVSEQGLSYYPDYPDLYFLRGIIFWEVHLSKLAQSCFEKCLQFKKTPLEYTTTRGVTSFLALENLSEVYARKGAWDQAVNCLGRAYQQHKSKHLLVKIGRFIQRKGLTATDIVDYFKEKLKIKSPLIIKVLYEIGDYESCITYIDKIKQADLIMYKIKSLMKLGHFQEAEAMLDPIIKDSPKNTEAVKLTCLCKWLKNQRENAVSILSSKTQDDLTTACSLINNYIFSLNNNLDIEIDHYEDLCREIIAQIIDYGDLDLALFLMQKINNSSNISDSYYKLGQLAFAHNYYQEARKLLERSLYTVAIPQKRYFLLGNTWANLGRYQKAFTIFEKMRKLEPDNEAYSAAALEQLLHQFISLISGCHNNEQEQIQKYLIYLNTLKKKVKFFREVNIHGE